MANGKPFRAGRRGDGEQTFVSVAGPGPRRQRRRGRLDAYAARNVDEGERERC
jgi:hypothetical protein